LQREANDDVEGQVRRAIRLTTGRTAKDDELRRDVEFVRGAGLRQYCLMLLNANEFIYLD
jgi:hypothetical protein